jgi:sigma-B regulation protein RsbU (phosphoserine phosphatase)
MDQDQPMDPQEPPNTAKQGFSGFSQRLTEFASRFEEKSRPGPKKDSARRQAPAWESAYWSLRDLFTQGVTRAELKHLIQHDTREALRFYARGIDFESLKRLPWYQRYPLTAWKVFLALAYKLSPARRIAFAVAIFSSLLGWVQFLAFHARSEAARQGTGVFWLLISFVILFLLLLIELRDKLDLKSDLEVAREIQFGLVPAGPYYRNGTSIHCYMKPANTVGGDYYDIIDLEDNRVGIVVGDVAGKGMPAALLMALLQGSLRTLLAAGHRGTDLMAKLNVYLCSTIPANSLVTLFYGELDTAAGDLLYVNAGHNAPFLIRQGQSLERLHSTAMVLGIDPNWTFETMTAHIGPGERLLLYTDGISEAFNTREEEYGDPRIAEYLEAHAGLPSAELIQGLVKDVLQFCGATRLTDDMTLMAIAREAWPGSGTNLGREGA